MPITCVSNRDDEMPVWVHGILRPVVKLYHNPLSGQFVTLKQASTLVRPTKTCHIQRVCIRRFIYLFTSHTDFGHRFVEWDCEHILVSTLLLRQTLPRDRADVLMI